MKHHTYRFLLTGLLFSSTLVYAQKTIPVKKLQADFDELVAELKSLHQGLYQYTSKEKTDVQIDSIRSTITGPMTVLEFYKTVNAVIALTNEGHSGSSLPTKQKLKLGLSKSFLPLGVAFFNKKTIIRSYFGEDSTQLKPGMRLISVNGHSMEEFMKKLKPYIVTDGFNETSFYEWTGWNFPMYYRLAYGEFDQFEIEAMSLGSDKKQIIQLEAVKATRIKWKHNQLKRISIYKGFVYETIKQGIGYLSVPNFFSADDYPLFYKKAFDQIKADSIQHLIIDIQRNIGGEEGNENLLASYLFVQPFQKYKEVSAPAEAYIKFKDRKSAKLDQWTLDDQIPKRGASTLMSDYFSEFKYTKPDQGDIYLGKVYVLISGVTFSGGAEFASMLKMTNRAVFIGEETGGAYEGNVSGHSETIKLTHSKIKVNIPIVHFKMNVDPKIKGRGIMPDHVVPQQWEDYLKGKNSKLNYTLDLIHKTQLN